LTDSRSKRDIDATINELRRLGWLVGLPIHGVWAFIPAGQDELADPCLALRAWLARDPDARFRLAGAAAAWHLGYLDRAPDRPTAIWLPATTRLPDGLRPYVSLVQIKWGRDAASVVSPTTRLLLQRKLDIVSWASGLPAFGPEALIVQLAARPSSFHPWTDLVAHLNQLVADCDDERLATLLADQSTSAWQRASYLLHAAGQQSRGLQLLDQRPRRPLPKIKFEHAGIDHADPGRLDGRLSPCGSTGRSVAARSRKGIAVAGLTRSLVMVASPSTSTEVHDGQGSARPDRESHDFTAFDASEEALPSAPS